MLCVGQEVYLRKERRTINITSHYYSLDKIFWKEITGQLCASDQKSYVNQGIEGPGSSHFQD